MMDKEDSDYFNYMINAQGLKCYGSNIMSNFIPAKKGLTFKELAKEYQEKYRLEVLPALSKGRQKLYGWYGEEKGWYDPDNDPKIQMIDALYDLFDRLKKGGADNAGTK